MSQAHEGSREVVRDQVTNKDMKWYQSPPVHFIKESGEQNGSLARIRRMKEMAHANLLQQGLPEPKSEEWKYTDIREVRSGAFSLASPAVLSQIEDRALDGNAIPDLKGYVITLIDGFVATDSRLLQEQLPTGVKLVSFRELFVEAKSDLSDSAREKLYNTFFDHFGQLASTTSDGVAALNTSFFQDGVFLIVEKNVRVEKPIILKHVSSGLVPATATFQRVLTVVEDGAEVDIVEHFTNLITSPALHFCSSLTELRVGKNVRLNHFQVGDDHEELIRFSRIVSEQGRDSKVSFYTINTGGKIIRNEVRPALYGEGGFVGLYGLNIAKGHSLIDNNTILDHAVPHCESDEQYRGVYSDVSQGVFSGTIIVRKDAQKTNAIQNSASVLLSEKASVNTKPQLKIWADDVKCTHGATVGQLDEDQLFYLRSRGVGQAEAQAMLLTAFAGEITRRVENHALRAYFEKFLGDSGSFGSQN